MNIYHADLFHPPEAYGHRVIMANSYYSNNGEVEKGDLYFSSMETALAVWNHLMTTVEPVTSSNLGRVTKEWKERQNATRD